ncbi:MAG: hemerythrin domain-containing protein [Gammaproteobacteria bacterium]|nr:hemerythrin domain-containing protein [Gammaproteobacteria bacterium]
MKRVEHLQYLSREHHQSLTLAQKAIKTANTKNSEAISRLCKEIINDYPKVWQTHFKIEEENIFQLFSKSMIREASDIKLYLKISNLCYLLAQEHQVMNDYYEQMKEGDYSILGEFGALLKKHTRTEERELFPLLEKEMTIEELNRVLQVSQNYRK